jgi:hypothetical protein
MARGLFEEAYLSLPPWDIGRPQGEIIRLAEDGEIREAFDRGWKVDSIREARFETNLGPEGCRGWLSSMTRE